mgnify:CR=1 FL=1
MNTEILEQIGLSKNEIKVYFALLELGQTSATPIVKKAGIPHSKIYPVIEKLTTKGLVSYVIKNNVRHFQASDPRTLIDLLQKKELQIKAQKRLIEKIIPRIELKQKLSREKQEATVYEGLSGIKAALKYILETVQRGDEYRAFMLGESLRNETVTRTLQHYHKQRIAKGVTVRLISEKVHKPWAKNYRYGGMKIRYTDQKLPVGIFIFTNHVMTIIWEDMPTAFVIKSQKNYEYYKTFFDYLWKISETT